MKILLTFIIVLLNYTYASIDYVKIYRTNGINEVEKLLNKELKSKKYWKNNLENKNVKNGYYESLNYILVCNTNLNDINIYDTKNNKLIFTSSVLSGKNTGTKVKEGDLKTPIGVYKITNKLSKVDPFYGPFALVTNYPNKFDKSLGRTGHGIWIHGVPLENKKRDPYTKGCIALDNNKLQKLNSNIVISNSLLIINDNKKVSSSISDITLILSNIYSWREAWKYSNINSYLSFYSKKDFKRANGSRFNRFKDYKTRIFRRKGKKIINLTNINIIPYPNHLNKNMYKITMHEEYRAKNYKYIGKKELYVEIINNKMKILFE